MMETETVGRVLTTATIENLEDLWDVKNDRITPEQGARVGSKTRKTQPQRHKQHKDSHKGKDVITLSFVAVFVFFVSLWLGFLNGGGGGRRCGL